LLYCEPACQQAVRDAMRKHGIQEMTFAFDTHGAHAIVNDPFIDGDQRGGSRWIFLPTGAGISTRATDVSL